MKTLSVDTVLDVVGRLLRGDIERDEVASWARGYSELMQHHAVRFLPVDKTDLLMDAIIELSSADLVAEGEHVLNEPVLRHLYVQLSQGVMVQ